MFKFIKILTNIIYPVSTLGLIIFCFLTCGGKKQHGEQQAVLAKDKRHTFVLPVIPSELTLPKDRADYLAVHYWDNFDFSDTAYVHLPEITEQAFADYLDILSHANKPNAYSSIENTLRQAGKEGTGRMYQYLRDLYKQYLYDANSPLRNEEFYIPVIRYIIEDTITDTADKQRAAFELEMLLKNRVGELATDITYTLATGKKGRLYDLHNQYTILYFYNPDCPACKETTAYLASSRLINSRLLSGRLDLLAVYPDSDLDLWRKHANLMPPLWLNGYDKGQVVFGKKLYDLKAIPSLYLLDASKHVLLKDAPAQTIEEYLIGEQQPRLEHIEQLR
ncbi:DUF5106 domain-containing protein [Dysgonomonas sp. HGC4]|uniref:DUF5106 domain-containing protein n=1 Tax=Dysgonomonas sp. HGC4 TaxID=1658009 RepID=UPI00068133DB|nr:DUF5106 domain-containing protein [Dysgonomonas sp. HGC4]MBD8349948.1 DUF5106 domain-containing protein [Dysgonomonas sp. HGC4]